MSASACRPAASASATIWSKTASSRASLIRVLRATKLPASSTKSGPASPFGKKASASASAGTAATTELVRDAAAATSLLALTKKSPASAMTVATPTTCSLPQKPSLPCPIRSKAISSLFDGLGPNGSLLVVGAGAEPVEAPVMPLLLGRSRVQGWPSGVATDSEDTLRFAELTGVRPMIEQFPLAKVNEAYARMNSGKAQFRVVLTM